MKIKENILNDLNLALNESRILDCTILQNEKEVITIFDQFALLEDGTTPKDTRVKIIFENVSRIAALLKLGEWNNKKASIKTLSLESISQEIKQLEGEEMYGWDFFNTAKSEIAFHKWEKNASLDIIFQPKNHETNTIDIFSEHFSENPKTIDLRIWFEKFRIESMLGETIDEIAFIQRGQRAWNNVFNGTYKFPFSPKSKRVRLTRSSIMEKLKNIFN